MTLHPVYHDEMVNKPYLYQPGNVPTRLDRLVTIRAVYVNGTTRVQGENGQTFVCFTRTIREIPAKRGCSEVNRTV